MQSLIKLQEHEDDVEASFWGAFETMPEENGDEDLNKVLGLVGVCLGHLGAISAMVGYAWPWLDKANALTLKWYDWLFFALISLALLFEVFGLIKFIMAAEEPNEATIFRAWRTNFLAQGTHTIVQIASFVTWMILVFLAQNLLNRMIDFIFMLAGILLAGAGLYFTFYVQWWWWNWDETGALRFDHPWELFGDDRYYEPKGDNDDDEDALAEESDINEF
jgi:hypothetical protein